MKLPKNGYLVVTRRAKPNQNTILIDDDITIVINKEPDSGNLKVCLRSLSGKWFKVTRGEQFFEEE